MPAGLRYEPSVGAVLSHVLPDGARRLGPTSALRRRVTWPLVARAGRLGEIHGGEIVLASRALSPSMARAAGDLAHAGVAALVLADILAREEEEMLVRACLPAGLVPPHLEPRRFKEEMERYIHRRRGELFALEQELHRTLVDAAIGGAALTDLLDTSARKAGKRVAVERDGELLLSSTEEGPLDSDHRHLQDRDLPAGWDQLLRQARLAAFRSPGPEVVTGPGVTALVAPVRTGQEQRGFVLLSGVGDVTLDEDEAVLLSLASACAIVEARQPAARAPGLGELLADPRLLHWPASTWWSAAALAAPSLPASRLERALCAELEVRDVAALLAREGASVLALAPNRSGLFWEETARAMERRLGAGDLMAGLGRAHAGRDGARTAVQEALAALERGTGPITRYEEVELVAMLASVPDGTSYVQARLGALLAGDAASRDLLDTLHAYLTSGRNATEAAKRLHVHRNTLLYRLHRIQDLLNVDLGDADTAFGLELALRIRAARGGQVNAGGGSG